MLGGGGTCLFSLSRLLCRNVFTPFLLILGTELSSCFPRNPFVLPVVVHFCHLFTAALNSSPCWPA